MLEVIVYFVIPVLVILIVAYFYVETKKRKIIEEHKKAVVLRVATIKNNFKTDLKRLVEQEVLTVNEHNAVFRIANNFFVFQPVTTKNLNYCEQLLNTIIGAMPTGGPDSINYDLGKEQVSLFVRSLPYASGDHNAAFYRRELPELIKQLIDSQEDMFETENEKNNEESPSPVSATAA
ncbi:hypothetical protein [Psychromonas ossibalaenae]|uniref:hypothetical protein n=1 Tax=Psychromonas ossibalaenae TaxID=444922 RepID=UPI00037F68D3|nr:hypothetical protein [Psychromonas ossibalaenae]